MITGALWVLGCQLVGEVVVRSLGIPVPGPVVGMVLLFGVLTGLQTVAWLTERMSAWRLPAEADAP